MSHMDYSRLTYIVVKIYINIYFAVLFIDGCFVLYIFCSL